MIVTPCGRFRPEVRIDRVAAKPVTCGHIDEDSCACPCHLPNPQLLHCQACCDECPACGRMIPRRPNDRKGHREAIVETTS